MKRYLVVLSLVFIAVVTFAFTGITDNVIAALKTGNAKGLSRYFGANVDLAVLKDEDVYSKAQAELIIKNFFVKHRPKGFKIIHQGMSKLGLQYAIGNLTTSNGNFRVTFSIKKTGTRQYIQQLRINRE